MSKVRLGTLPGQLRPKREGGVRLRRLILDLVHLVGTPFQPANQPPNNKTPYEQLQHLSKDMCTYRVVGNDRFDVILVLYHFRCRNMNRSNIPNCQTVMGTS